jgi:hypothetical protein
MKLNIDLRLVILVKKSPNKFYQSLMKVLNWLKSPKTTKFWLFPLASALYHTKSSLPTSMLPACIVKISSHPLSNNALGSSTKTKRNKKSPTQLKSCMKRLKQLGSRRTARSTICHASISTSLPATTSEHI